MSGLRFCARGETDGILPVVTTDLEPVSLRCCMQHQIVATNPAGWLLPCIFVVPMWSSFAWEISNSVSPPCLSNLVVVAGGLRYLSAAGPRSDDKGSWQLRLSLVVGHWRRSALVSADNSSLRGTIAPSVAVPPRGQCGQVRRMREAHAVHAFISCRLDYCKSLLAGVNDSRNVLWTSEDCSFFLFHEAAAHLYSSLFTKYGRQLNRKYKKIQQERGRTWGHIYLWQFDFLCTIYKCSYLLIHLHGAC